MDVFEIHKKFPTSADCLKYLEKIRWNNKPICPYCESIRVTSFKKGNRHHCNKCNRSFSVTVNTIFHKTKVDLRLWFVIISIIQNNEKRIRMRILANESKVNINTIFRIKMKIKEALAQNDKLVFGIVEAD